MSEAVQTALPWIVCGISARVSRNMLVSLIIYMAYSVVMSQKGEWPHRQG